MGCGLSLPNDELMRLHLLNGVRESEDGCPILYVEMDAVAELVDQKV